MKVIAVYNIKGGVGKTATSVNLAAVSAFEGNKTLIIDLDPQAATSFYFKADDEKNQKKNKGWFLKDDVNDAIIETEFYNLDILPADKDIRNLEQVFKKLKKSDSWFKGLVKPVGKMYDVIILDCQPGISLLSDTVFKNADVIVVPVIPTVLSLRTYEQLVAYFNEKDFKKSKLKPFFSMVEKRKKMHIESLRDFSRSHKECLNIIIPYNADVEKMGIHREPVVRFAPSSEAAKAYFKLWKQVKKAE
jgi:chromosome partitioning protein